MSSKEIPKNVLIVGAHPKGGVSTGPSIYVENLARCLSKHLKLTVLSPSKYYNQKEINDNNLNIVFTHNMNSPILPILMKSAQIGRNYDIIHTNVYKLFLLKYIFHKPFVMTAHGYLTFEGVANGKFKQNSIKFKYNRWIEKKAVQKADAVIAVGKTLREWIINEFEAEPEKIFYIPNGVDVDKFKPFKAPQIREKCRYSNDDKIIIFVKGFTEQNGIRYLMKAIPIILIEHPEIKVLAIGDGPLRGEIEKYIEKKDLLKTVQLLGRVPNKDVPYYLNASNIFISPGIKINGAQETFGISLIEAMACGLPVITTAIGGPKEIIEDGKDQMGGDVGYLVPPESEEAIADAVVSILEHPNYARETGERAMKYVRKRYTWDITSKRVLDVYDFALAKYKKRHSKTR